MSRYCVSYDNVDIEAVKDLRILVTSSAVGYVIIIAEHTINY
ncbi:hypothetical protein [Marispirochaeta aestuarii]